MRTGCAKCVFAKCVYSTLYCVLPMGAILGHLAVMCVLVVLTVLAVLAVF